MREWERREKNLTIKRPLAIEQEIEIQFPMMIYVEFAFYSFYRSQWTLLLHNRWNIVKEFKLEGIE